MPSVRMIDETTSGGRYEAAPRPLPSTSKPTASPWAS